MCVCVCVCGIFVWEWMTFFSPAINRRRIYDIINVLEALEMISKQSKNWYIWLGRTNLVATLAKLKVRQYLCNWFVNGH